MCTYCGCESIAVIGRFMAEHTTIVDATTALRSAAHAGDLARLAGAATALAELLGPHTKGEEAGLFAVLARENEFGDHVARLCSEHTSLDRQLAAIAAGDATQTDDFVYALREHINREENGLFPAAAIALAGPDWEEIDELTPPAGRT